MTRHDFCQNDTLKLVLPNFNVKTPKPPRQGFNHERHLFEVEGVDGEFCVSAERLNSVVLVCIRIIASLRRRSRS